MIAKYLTTTGLRSLNEGEMYNVAFTIFTTVTTVAFLIVNYNAKP